MPSIKPHSKKKYLLFLILFALSAVMFFPVHVFIVMDEKTGSRIHSGLVSQGDVFEIHYTHSVEHMAVTGIFLINDHYKIAPLETIFPSYGAGMPFMVKKKNLTYEKGGMRVRHHDVELTELRVFISHITRQRLIFKEVQIDLFQKIEDGGIAVINIRYIPFLLALLYW
jgi:hypothetical protein